MNDTIAAIATPPGPGGVGIVRLSGPAAPAIAGQIVRNLPAPREARFARFRDADGTALDEGIVLYFAAPHSFTGEDVIELQGHGGPVVMDLLLHRCLACGARLAQPGEFSQRAFLNGRIDLTQAEAIADLIEAGSAGAARLAARSLEGRFADRVRALVEGLTALRVYVEAAIDFSDEEIDFLADGQVAERLQALAAQLAQLERSAHTGQMLRDGLTLVITGRPNAGKSSLLNALADSDTAIVTEIPGTTRDLLRERIQIDGLPIHLIDTAGLRDGADRVEQEGIRRATEALRKADGILLVFDDRLEEHQGLLDGLELPPEIPIIRVRNKIDLTGRPPAIQVSGREVEVSLSARTGEGVPLLRQSLRRHAGLQQGEQGEFLARRRHLDALRRGGDHIAQAASQAAPELIAEELRLAQQALGEITGEVSSDDLLGRIFSSFCIGK